MKLGIIGCGIITQEAHVPALLRLKDEIEVVAVCNHSEEKALKVKDLLGNNDIPVFTRWEVMLNEQKNLDAVLIALPILLNYPVSKACLDAGLAVLCEKPAGADSAEAKKTLKFVASGRPFFMTAENFQFKPSIRRAVDIIKEGQIGDLHSIQLNVFQFMRVDNKYNQTLWRSHNKYPGGYLMDGGVHHIHVLQQIAGPVSNVMGRALCINSKLGSHDLGFAILEHSNGVVSSLNMGFQHCDGENSLKIFCSSGSLIVDEEKITVMSSDGDVQVVNIEDENTFYLEWRDFLDAFNGLSAGSIQQIDVVRDVRVVESIIQSGKEGKEISVGF